MYKPPYNNYNINSIDILLVNMSNMIYLHLSIVQINMSTLYSKNIKYRYRILEFFHSLTPSKLPNYSNILIYFNKNFKQMRNIFFIDIMSKWERRRLIINCYFHQLRRLHQLFQLHNFPHYSIRRNRRHPSPHLRCHRWNLSIPQTHICIFAIPS